MLNSLVAKSFSRDQLAVACAQTVDRNEVSILPPEAADFWRILITPTLRSFDPSSRAEASRLMRDLFHASQASEVRANALLVTHFANVRKYPEPHLLGILDSLLDLAAGSFLGLRVLCLNLRAEHVAQFDVNVRDIIGSRAKGGHLVMSRVDGVMLRGLQTSGICPTPAAPPDGRPSFMRHAEAALKGRRAANAALRYTPTTIDGTRPVSHAIRWFSTEMHHTGAAKVRGESSGNRIGLQEHWDGPAFRP